RGAEVTGRDGEVTGREMTEPPDRFDAGSSGPGACLRRSAVIVDDQALGRLPWFAPFFLRARRLRPVLPMVPPGSKCFEHSRRSGAVAANRADRWTVAGSRVRPRRCGR